MADFVLPNAENFSKFLEERFGEKLRIRSLGRVTDDDQRGKSVLASLNNTDKEVRAWVILLGKKIIGHYLTIEEDGDFGCVYNGMLGEDNPQLRKDEYTIIYWDENPSFYGTKGRKLKTFQRIDGHYDIPFP